MFKKNSMNLLFGGKEYHEVTATIVVKDIKLTLLPASGAKGGKAVAADGSTSDPLSASDSQNHSASSVSNANNTYTHYSVELERKGKWNCARKTRWMNTEYDVRDPKVAEIPPESEAGYSCVKRTASGKNTSSGSDGYVAHARELSWSVLNSMRFEVNFKTDQEIPKHGKNAKIDEVIESYKNGSTTGNDSNSADASSNTVAALWNSLGLPDNTTVKSKTAHPLTAAIHCFNIHQEQEDYIASLREAPLPTPSHPKKAFYGAKSTVVTCKDLKIDLSACVNSATKESRHQVPVQLPALFQRDHKQYLQQGSSPNASAGAGANDQNTINGKSPSPAKGATSVGSSPNAKYTVGQPQNCFLEITLACVNVVRKGADNEEDKKEKEIKDGKDETDIAESPERLEAPRESINLGGKAAGIAAAIARAAAGGDSSSNLPNMHLIQGIDNSKVDEKLPANQYFYKYLPHLSSKHFKPHYHEYAIIVDAVSLDVTLSTAKDCNRYGFGFFVDVTDGTPGRKMEHVCKALRSPDDAEAVAERVRNANAASLAFRGSGLYNINSNGAVATSLSYGRKVCDFSTAPITADSKTEREASWVICSCDSEEYSNVAVGNRTMCTSRYKTDPDDGRCRSSLKAQLSFGIIRVDSKNEYHTEVAWTQPVDLAEEVINVENFPDEGMTFSAKFAYGEQISFRLRRRCFAEPQLHMSPILEPNAFFAEINGEDGTTTSTSNVATPTRAGAPSIASAIAAASADVASRTASMQPRQRAYSNSSSPADKDEPSTPPPPPPQMPKTGLPPAGALSGSADDDPFAAADNEGHFIPSSQYLTPQSAPPPPAKERRDADEEAYFRNVAKAAALDENLPEQAALYEQ